MSKAGAKPRGRNARPGTPSPSRAGVHGPDARRSTRPAGGGAGLDRLWAPWRMSWLRHADAPAACLFCRVAAARADRRDLVLARRGHAVLMLNRYPYASAHLMIAVKRHAGRFCELSAGESDDLLELVALAERALEAEYAPHGVNYGLNVGKVAGAGFPGHLHLHMVPRWGGDTNFMPAIAQTRVLPEALDATWRRLRRSIASLARPASPARRHPARVGGRLGSTQR